MESPDQAQPTVAISYAWKREDKRYPLVRRLCKRLKESGIHVIWDDRLQNDDQLASFYEQLATSDVLIAVISDEYFRSENCMLKELLPAFQHVWWIPERFSKKVIFLIDRTAVPLLEDPAKTDRRSHPLQSIIDHWKEMKEMQNTINNNEQNSRLVLMMNDLLNPLRGINCICECIRGVMTVRGARISRNNFQDVLELVNGRIRLWQEARPQDSNPRPSNQDGNGAYLDDLRERSITGLPIPDRPGVPVPPNQNAPTSLSLSLMLILQESNEPCRYMLIPELHVFSTEKADLSPDQWPDPLKQAQTKLQNFDNVRVGKTGELRVVKSRRSGDSLGRQVKTWLDVVKAAATELNQRSSGLQPELVEIVLPKTLLHHDFGASLRVPVTSDPMPLATHQCFMVRSLERAQEHCKHDQTPLPQKWRGSVSELLVVHVCEDHTDQWHVNLFERTQGDNIRFCVVLPSLSSTKESRQRLLNSLVDSFLPLVVYWPPGESDATDCATRLQYVYELLAATPDLSPSSSAPEAGKKVFEVVPLKMEQQDIINIHGIAKQRKNLNTQTAMNNQSAIVLMDHPDRWPRWVKASQSPLSSPTVT